MRRDSIIALIRTDSEWNDKRELVSKSVDVRRTPIGSSSYLHEHDSSNQTNAQIVSTRIFDGQHGVTNQHEPIHHEDCQSNPVGDLCFDHKIWQSVSDRREIIQRNCRRLPSVYLQSTCGHGKQHEAMPPGVGMTSHDRPWTTTDFSISAI